MKQSTPFAQVATNLLNVLQGYTKGIRFVAVLTVLLIVSTNAWSATYSKVTTAPSDWSGVYLIVYETGNVAFNGALTTLDAASNTVSVEIKNNTIAGNDNIDKAIFTISKSGNNYNIKSASGKYIGNASNSNALTSSDNTLNNTISINNNNDKTVNIVSSGGAYLRYNATSGQNRFRYYKSSSYTNQKAICLYKLKEETNYSVTSNLSNVTSASTNPTTVLESAEELNLAYAAKNGWNLPDAISVTMGGNSLSLNDEYTWDKENGKVWIVPDNGFTGNIVVTINGWQQLTPPNGLNVSNITSSSATLSWTKDSNAKSYTINILGENDPEAEPVLVIEDITTNSYTLIGLAAETEYLIGLVAVGDGTTYTDSQQECFDVFETLPAGYTITYNTDGGDAIPAASGTALPNPLPTPIKEHYEFQGWYTNEACTQTATAGATINADITLYAKWEAVTYTITLVPNYPNSLTGVFKDKGGNTIAGNLLIPIKYGTESQPLTNFYSTLSLDGYQFDAFYTQTEGGQKRVNTGTLTKDLTLYARWKKEYTVTWNVNGKNTGTTIIVEGKEWTLPEVDESCNGKQFVGWTTTEILEEQDNAPAILYTETSQFPLETNIYYAVFANVEVTGTGEYVKVTKDLPDYSGEYLIVYEAGLLAFDGGQDKENLEDGVSIAVTIENNTIEATTEMDAARFTIASITGGYYVKSASGYYIGCTANDKGLYASQNEQYLNDITWGEPWENADEGVIITSQNKPILLYSTQASRFRYYSSAQEPIALYKKTGTNMTNYTTSCVPTYTITWKNDDDTVLETDKVKENTTPTYDGATPTKEADAQYTYTFDSWTPDIVEATEDATYTATYTATVNKYTITWKNGETTLETDNNVPYGETPTYNGATPTKAATAQYTYTFNSWSPEVTTVIGDATYSATFSETVNKYQVTFNMNGHGDEITAQTVDYGSTAAEPSPAPTADGYEFAGWYKDEQCTIPWNFDTDVITGNTAIHAKWLQIFTITWKANGLEYTTTEGTEGEQITPPAEEPNPEDYCGDVFVGWTTENPVSGNFNEAPTVYNEQATFPTATGDQTFYAVFADYGN